MNDGMDGPREQWTMQTDKGLEAGLISHVLGVRGVNSLEGPLIN